MLSRPRYSILLMLVASLLANETLEARGFGGVHGGLGGRAAGGLGAGGLGAGGLGGGQFGGGQLSGLRSELGGDNTGRLNGLQGRLQGSRGNLADRFSGLGQRPTANLANDSRLDSLAGKIPSDGKLSKFLGIPSDHGLHNLSGQTQSKMSQAYDKAKSADGPLSGFISGQTQKPASRIYDKAKAGDGPFKNFIPGQTQKPGSRIYDKVKAGDGPFKNFIPGETQKPLSRLYDSVRAGNHPLGPWSPWRVHNNAIIIRRNFNNYAVFTPGWYSRYPAAWYPPVWYDGNPWTWVAWPSLAEYCGYATQPVDYDYGTNVVYQQNSVVVNGSTAGTPAEYYQQAEQLAKQGSGADVSNSGKWMSLGVFAVSESNQKSSSMVMQLAINRDGVIRGNYDNTSTKETQVIHGAVDKQTLRAAWTIGKHQDIVLDTGVYNLTKEETSVLVHLGDNETKQWLMVRIDKKKGDNAETGDSTKN